MEIDGTKLATALGCDQKVSVQTELCRAQIGNFTNTFEAAGNSGDRLLVACTQEAPLFRDLAEDHGGDTPLAFVNIRERAGWCADSRAALPKMAALIAQAAQDVTPAGLTSMHSDGMCVVYGAGQIALSAAEKLSERLDITLVLSDPADVIPPAIVAMPIATGKITSATGVLGGFGLMLEDYALALPSLPQRIDVSGPPGQSTNHLRYLARSFRRRATIPTRRTAGRIYCMPIQTTQRPSPKRYSRRPIWWENSKSRFTFVMTPISVPMPEVE